MYHLYISQLHSIYGYNVNVGMSFYTNKLCFKYCMCAECVFVDSQVEIFCTVFNQYAGFYWKSSASSLPNWCFLFNPETHLTIRCTILKTLGIKFIDILIFILIIIYLQHIVVYQLIKYPRGCDAWLATTKMIPSCIFLTNCHYYNVNRAIGNCFKHALPILSYR